MSHQYQDRGAPYGYDSSPQPGRRPPPQSYNPSGRPPPQQRPPPVRIGHQGPPPPGPRGPMRPPPPQQYSPASEIYYEGSAYGGADEFDQWPLPARPFAPSGRNSPSGSPRGSPRVESPSGSPRRGPPPPRPMRPDYQDQGYDQPRPSHDQQRPSYDQPRPSRDQPRPSYDQPRQTARVAPAERSYRQPPPQQHGPGQWSGDGHRSPQPPHPPPNRPLPQAAHAPPNRPPPQAAHPPPSEFQQPQALQQAVHAQQRNQRAPLGPPPSARRGPAFNYPPVASVHPIAEETDSMRGSIRNASVAFSQGHSSYASDNAIPIGIPGYYLEERGSGYSHPGAAMGRPSVDSGFGHPSAPMGRPSVDNRSRPELDVYDEPPETTYETYEDGRGSAQRDYAESPSPEPGALIRQASIGKRTKPTLTTVKSGERMGRDTEGLERKIPPPKQPLPQVPLTQQNLAQQPAPRLNRAMMHSRVSSTSTEGDDMERSGQEEKAFEAANASSDIITPGAIPAPLTTSKNKIPSRDNLITRTPSSSDVLSSGTGLIDASSDESVKVPKKRSSRELLGAMLGKDRSRSRSPLSLIGTSAEQRASYVANSDRGADTPISAHPESPLPDLSDLPEARRRPPKLDIDAVRDAEARGSLTSLPDLIRRATKLATNLDRGRTASRLGMNFFDGLDPAERALAVENANRRQSSVSDMLSAFPAPGTPGPFDRFSKLQHSQLPSESDAGEVVLQPKKRKCCGMPVWLFVVLMLILFLLIVAAVLVPVVLLIIRPGQIAGN